MKRKADDATPSSTGMHVLSTPQFDEPMLRILISTAKAMKAMVAISARAASSRTILANVFYDHRRGRCPSMRR